MFEPIEGALALVRKSQGIYAECKLYTWREKTFVKVGGGFLSIQAQKFGTYWLTSNPKINIYAFEGFDLKDLK